MTQPEIERFYSEYRRLGRLIGVRERDLPQSWSEFREYFDRMIAEELVPTASVERVLRSVKHASPPPVPIPDALWRAIRMPAGQALWLGGVGLMSPVVRDRLGIPWSRRDEARFRAFARVSRSLTPVMPERLRVMGPAQLRFRRRAIARGPLGVECLSTLPPRPGACWRSRSTPTSSPPTTRCRSGFSTQRSRSPRRQGSGT